MFQRLEELVKRYEQLGRMLADPRVFGNHQELQRYAREHSQLEELIETFRRYQKINREIEDNQQLLTEDDEELKDLAKSELSALRQELAEVEKELKIRLLPRDPNDEKNILLEIRAGTGGEEAALFAADLFRMYCRFAEKRGWRLEVMSQNPTGVGGLKEIIALIEGKRVYSRLKYESGIHRVQRVPVTESSGRIHTSAVTVAILPEAEEVEVKIDPDELRIDVFRSTGPGGQSVNTTDSAVRITHLPTGMVVTCQDEKSQHKNKAKALKVLRARLLDRLEQQLEKERSDQRRSQVGSGDRSEKIRTYNFPQSRVTDHRISLTLHRLEEILEGDLNDLIEALTTYYQTEALNSKLNYA